MRCRAAQKRLVAHRDDELAPGEATRLSEHLSTCPSCRDLDERLQAVTPRPFVEVSVDAEQAMWTRLDDAVEHALDEWERDPKPLAGPGWFDWLTEEARVPRAALFAYAAILAAALGWGTWMAIDASAPDAAPSTVAAQPTEMPADLYRPAAWHPDGSEED